MRPSRFHRTHLQAAAGLLAAALSGPGGAAPGEAAAPPAAAASVAAPGEPQVRRIVVEDDGVRVDELRVRGVTTRIRVQPKTPGSAAYEILPPDAGAQVQDGGPTARASRGQRVWNVLAF